MEAQSPLSETAGRRSAPVRAMGAFGTAWLAGCAPQGSAKTPTIEMYIPTHARTYLLIFICFSRAGGFRPKVYRLPWREQPEVMEKKARMVQADRAEVSKSA